MTEQSVINLANNIFGIGQYPEPKEILFREDFNKLSLDNGTHELGHGKWVSKNTYININDRCDSQITIIDNHPEIDAIQSNHYHKKGWVGSLIVYLKKK